MEISDMYKLGRVLMLSALGLLLAHMMIPHLHNSQLWDEQHVGQHKTASTVLDFIKLAFHNDPGANHLEDYYSQDTGQDLPKYTIPQAGLEACLADPVLVVLPQEHISQVRYYHLRLESRAPPDV